MPETRRAAAARRKELPTVFLGDGGEDESMPDAVEGEASSATRKRRVTVRKVPSSRSETQEPNLDDDDDFATPKKSMRFKTPGVKRGKEAVQSTTRKECEQPNASVQLKKKTYPTVRCAPGAILGILSVMKEPMKNELIRLDFKDFLGFSLGKIDDRSLATFLMDHIELEPLRIVVNGRELPITEAAVKNVLGVPNGSKALDVLSASDKAYYLKELRAECVKRGMEKIVTERCEKNPALTSFSNLKPNQVPRYVVEEFAKMETVDDWNIKCFFMTLFDGFLFSTSSLYVPGEVYYYCKNVEEFGKYNLCKAIVDNLTEKASKWKKKPPSERTGAAAIQGCVAFLVVYYLDNLYCPGSMLADAKSTPRVSLFTASLVDKLAKADLSDRDGTIYGNLGFRNKVGTCYEDVRVDDLLSPGVPPPPGARRKRQRLVASEVAPKPSAANTAAAKASRAQSKPLRPSSKPPRQSSKTQPSPTTSSAAVHNADDVAPSLHLLPKFSDMISQMEDEKLQAEARLALQEHDSRMDAALKMVEDGKRMVSEGEVAIKDAHREVVAEISRILGIQGGSPSGKRASSGTVLEVPIPTDGERVGEKDAIPAHGEHGGESQAIPSNASIPNPKIHEVAPETFVEPHTDADTIGKDDCPNPQAQSDTLLVDTIPVVDAGLTDPDTRGKQDCSNPHDGITNDVSRGDDDVCPDQETHDESILRTPICLEKGLPGLFGSGDSHHQWTQGPPLFDSSAPAGQGTHGRPVFDASDRSASHVTQVPPLFDNSFHPVTMLQPWKVSWRP